MTFLASLGAIYLIVSLLIGVFLTIVTWEKRPTFSFITFMCCACCFAAIWPFIVLLAITDKK
jgi:hypothetical protein